MAAQVVAILLLILDEAVPSTLNLYSWGIAILWVSLVLSLVSAAQYVRQFVTAVLPRNGAHARSSCWTRPSPRRSRSAISSAPFPSASSQDAHWGGSTPATLAATTSDSPTSSEWRATPLGSSR